jgi:hypothetical protein
MKIYGGDGQTGVDVQTGIKDQFGGHYEKEVDLKMIKACNISKLCERSGGVLIAIGYLMYFLEHFNVGASIVGIGGLLIIPDNILNFKREFSNTKKLDLYKVSKFIAMVISAFSLFIYSIYIFLTKG